MLKYYTITILVHKTYEKKKCVISKFNRGRIISFKTLLRLRKISHWIWGMAYEEG